jgi:hypothetical protein
MAFQEGNGQIVCRACSAVHDVRWSRMPVREHTTITCLACRDVAYEGVTHRDFFNVRLTPAVGR